MPVSKPPAALAIAVFAVFTGWMTWQAKRLEGGLRDDSGTAMVGRDAPAFTLDSTDGAKITLADFRGKKTVALIFWASWCGPCRMELPVVKAFYRKARPMRDDFEILAISVDEYADSALGAAHAMNLPFPVLVNGERIASAYGVGGIPQTLIVDKSGKVKSGQTGFNFGLEMVLAQDFGLDPKLFLKEPNAAASH